MRRDPEEGDPDCDPEEGDPEERDMVYVRRYEHWVMFKDRSY